jgi:hypothetical protein
MSKNYGVLSVTSDGLRSILAVSMSLLDAESYVASLTEDGERLGYRTTFQVVGAQLPPMCARCGALCETCRDDK